MDQKQLFRQILEFNKTTFDHAFKTMSFFQNASEQCMIRFLFNPNWMPKENKKAFDECFNALRRYHEYFKSCSDENYRNVMASFDGPHSQTGTKDK